MLWMRRAQPFWPVPFLLLIMTAAAAAQCGDGVVTGEEECDDGGTCTGGLNAGTPCMADTDCLGDGVCIDSTAAGTSCSTDTQCPGGRCARCKTFGGDGCAANCTAEADVPVNLRPGAGGIGSFTGSGGLLYSAPINLALPTSGTQVFTVGKQRDGVLPLVVRASSAQFAQILVPAGCACVQAVAAKTCGGTVYEADGSGSLDCTPVVTPGDSVCDGRNPCAYVHGPGNSASGRVGCVGLEGPDVGVTQDSGGSSGIPGALVVALSGSGGPGSAVVFTSASTRTRFNACPADVCNDPGAQFDQVTVSTLPTVTGTATATMFNINATDGRTLGPAMLTGAPLSCGDLEQGLLSSGALVGASLTRRPLGDVLRGETGDNILMSQLVMAPICGNGRIEPGEHCDDGNVASGDTCPGSCTYTGALIRGDRRSPFLSNRACQVEWYVVNPGNRTDRFVLPSMKQVCPDQDSTCDFDPTPGQCRLQVVVCVNNEDPHLLCEPSGVSEIAVHAWPRRLESGAGVVRSALGALRDPQDPAAGFSNGIPITPAQRNLCSAPFSIDVAPAGHRLRIWTRSADTSSPYPDHRISRLDLLCGR